MAELIKKKDVIEQIKSIPCSTLEEFACKELAMNRIKLIPSTTEAEIRAKSIDEFADKLRRKFRDIGAFTGYEVKWKIDELVEQLKGE